MTEWIDAGLSSELKVKRKRVMKAGRKQILLIVDGDRIFACNNRCPHEGYPLSEGTLGPGCTLTCNWHNWKFNLQSGETLVGGDRLRQYPVEERDGHIWVDVTDSPAGERQQRALSNLEDACGDNDYERIAREIARFRKAEGDPLEPLRHMIQARFAHFEFGMEHAFAAAPDWITLFNKAKTESHRLAALVEPVAHIAWDTLREPEFEYTVASTPWHAQKFIDCIEVEDESAAIAYLTGALARGAVHMREVKSAFARTALAHYQGFGHSAIYTTKAFELIEKLGPNVVAPVLKSLVRSLIYASREDRIPEFRYYTTALAKGPALPSPSAPAASLVGQSIDTALDRVRSLPGDTEEKYKLLLEASAIAMLRYDLTVDDHIDKPVSHNVRWLDFTHALTFANAIRKLCNETPDLWPKALLQMACFLGRNSPFLLPHSDTHWEVRDSSEFFSREQIALYDHGIREPIYACHRVKVLFAVEEEVRWAGPGSVSQALMAATNRYLHTPIKNHHITRAAHQALSFVEAEG